MEQPQQQTIRQRRFDSLSARRKQKEEQANSVYELMDTEPQRPDSTRSKNSRSPSTDSVNSSPRSSPEVNASSSVETLSDMSVTTPNGMSIMISDMKKQNEALEQLSKAPPLRLTLPTMPQQQAQLSPKPVLASSLNKPSDFSFDNFSDVDDIEVFEVATPITYVRPNRPSMVSIFNILNKEGNREAQKALPPRPDVPSRDSRRPTVNKRLSTTSSRSGFMAGEATPFEIPDLPDNAMTMISNASQTDLSAPNRQQEPTLKKQKSSIGLLSKAIKYGHSRMVSRAQSISQAPNHPRPQSQREMPPPKPVVAPTPKVPPTPPDRPLAPLPRHASARSISRPQTATASIGPPPVTALPPCPESLPSRASPVAKPSPSTPGHSARKKSISALRNRSDSIGNALMAMGRSKSRSVAKEAPVPPLPGQPADTTTAATDKTSIDLSAFPNPPPPSRPQSSAISSSRPLMVNNVPLHGLGVTVH